MKKLIKNIAKVLILLLLTVSTASVFAQGPPPPPGGNSGSTNGSGNSLGSNAPVGSGLFILLGLGAAYGGRKLYQMKAEDSEE